MTILKNQTTSSTKHYKKSCILQDAFQNLFSLQIYPKAIFYIA